MECCQFLTPSLCFQKLRITSGFEFFFTTLAVDGTIQKSGKQLRERCPESKETLVAQRLWVCIFFVNERHSESLVVIALQGIPTFYAHFFCPRFMDNFPACVAKYWVILGL